MRAFYFVYGGSSLAPPCHSPAAGALPRFSGFDITFILSDCAAQFGQTCLKQASLKENEELTARVHDQNGLFHFSSLNITGCLFSVTL